MSGDHGGSCVGRGDDLFLHAAGALADDERERLEAHLAGGCLACRREQRVVEGQLAELAYVLDPVEPPPDVRARLLARVAGEPAAEAATRVAAGGRSRRVWLPLAAGLALLVGAGLGALLAERQRAAPLRAANAELHERLAALEAERAELEANVEEQDEELASLEDSLELARERLRMFEGDSLVRVALHGQGELAGVEARMFWEWKEEYTCYVHARSLPEPPEGHAQVVWLEDARGGFFRVGSLVHDASGDATVFAKLPQEERSVVRVAVSLEIDAPGPPAEAPDGPILLSAEL